MTARSNPSSPCGSGSSWPASCWPRTRPARSDCLQRARRGGRRGTRGGQVAGAGRLPVAAGDPWAGRRSGRRRDRSPVPTTVDVDGIGRYRPEVEAATYFCCLEAMQNAMKHAAGIKRISVSLPRRRTALRGQRRRGWILGSRGQVWRRPHQHARPSLGRWRAADDRTAPGEGTCVSGTVPLNQNGDRFPATFNELLV